MSNWCINKIKIETEDEELIERVCEDVRSELFCFDFNKLIPMPDDVEDWRDWMQENWGTSNFYGARQTGKGEWVVSTAWCPPYEILKAMSKKYGCVITDEYWIEQGWGCGKLTAKDGEIVSDEEWEECFE